MYCSGAHVLILPIGYLLLVAAGLVYAIFAAYLYLRFERSATQRHVPVAVASLTIHYVLIFASPYVRGYVLVPTLSISQAML